MTGGRRLRQNGGFPALPYPAMNLPLPPRRRFLKSATGSAAALAFSATARAANDGKKIRLAMIGPGGMGMQHVKTLCQRKDVEFLWVIDADAARAAAAAKTIQ